MPRRRARPAPLAFGIRRAMDAAIWFELAEQHGTTEFLGYDT
jgi:alanyl-tRNA synthetase